MPLVKRGPYRFVRHPNYLVVAGEILVLPLAFGEIWVAIVFSLANAAVLYWRIRQEETGLVTRRIWAEGDRMLRFSGPFLFLGLVPVLYYAVGPAAPLLSIALLLLALIGRRAARRAAAMPARAAENPRGFRLLVLLYIPAQIAVTAWAVWVSRQADAHRLLVAGHCRWASPAAFSACWRRMRRCIAAIPSRRLLGNAMLTAMSYRHFRIAHIHGHHRWAGTEQDSATARLGESFYHFLLRTVAGQFRGSLAVRAAAARPCASLGDLVVMAALFALIALIAGPRALLFFLLQSMVAVIGAGAVQLHRPLRPGARARRQGPPVAA